MFNFHGWLHDVGLCSFSCVGRDVCTFDNLLNFRLGTGVHSLLALSVSASPLRSNLCSLGGEGPGCFRSRDPPLCWAAALRSLEFGATKALVSLID